MLNEITKKINCKEYLNSLDCWYGIRPNGDNYYTVYWFIKDSDGISSIPYTGDYEKGVRIDVSSTGQSDCVIRARQPGYRKRTIFFSFTKRNNKSSIKKRASP